MLPGLLAILLGVGGGYVLFDAWRARGGLGKAAVGWSLLAAASVACVVAAGPEFGTAYALLGLSAIGVAFVGWGMEVRVPKRAPVARETLPGDGANWGGVVGRFVLAVPIAGGAAALVSTVLTGWMPGSFADRHALAILGMPVLWGAAAYWVLADPKPARAGAILTGAGAVAAASVFA